MTYSVSEIIIYNTVGRAAHLHGRRNFTSSSHCLTLHNPVTNPISGLPGPATTMSSPAFITKQISQTMVNSLGSATTVDILASY